MAMRRVTAYYMHETERSAALPHFVDPQVTESFVTGEVDEAAIPALRGDGLIVQDESPPPPDGEELPARVSDLQGSARPGAPGVGAARGATAFRFDDAVPAAVDFYAVRIHGPLLEARRQRLAALGVELLETHGRGAYTARLTSAQVPEVNALPFVDGVAWIAPEESAPRTVTAGADADAGSGVRMLTFDVRLRRPEDRSPVEQWLRERHLTIAGSASRKVRVYAPEGAPALRDLARLPEVDRVTEYVAPKLFNDAARRVLGLDPPAGAGGGAWTGLAQDGNGQIVAVADTGIDDAHPDFAGRIVGTVARGRPGRTDDPHGHGTHVAGSALGDGAASGGRLKGAAPKARLFFQSLLDAGGGLGGLPVDLGDLFAEAYAAGARIHNNSWGAATASTYTMSSEEVDAYVRDHPDMLVVIAAGNEGVSTNGQRAAKGFVDWLSIGSPASCKNALTVGASRSARTDGPSRGSTWSTWWPAAYPHAPIAHEPISGDPDCLAAFSSRGPCDDRRIKPDVVAPGTDIASAKSSRASITRFWGRYPSPPAPADPYYAYDGGTSMAAPLVSGCAALVRQYYLDERQHPPSAALLKATLVNGTEWLGGADADAPEVGVPNYHQGHGRVCMSATVPNPSRPALALAFVDDWQTPARAFTQTGERRRWQFRLPAGVPVLRLCLAYTDAPARSLQNNLNLLVHHQESGTKWLGNAKLPVALTLPDPDNNVESVRVDAPPAGTYFVQVFVGNMLRPPQDFALVVTADGLPALTEI